MTAYEYKVVPAPAKGQKARGIKGSDGRFAHALEGVMNAMASKGWEFQRTETLPSEERTGLTSSTTTYQNVMVFRRLRTDDISAFKPQLLERPAYFELPSPQGAPLQAPHTFPPETPLRTDQDTSKQDTAMQIMATTQVSAPPSVPTRTTTATPKDLEDDAFENISGGLINSAQDKAAPAGSMSVALLERARALKKSRDDMAAE